MECVRRIKMGKARMKRRTASPKDLHKNATFKSRDFKYPLERTAGGTLYARLPSGQMVKVRDTE